MSPRIDENEGFIMVAFLDNEDTVLIRLSLRDFCLHLDVQLLAHCIHVQYGIHVHT